MPVKEEIKAWLKRLGLSREWLADKIGVSKRTVDNWLSSNIDIPERSLAMIQQLIDDSEKVAEGINTNIFSVECSLDQFRRFSRAALSDGLILEDWALRLLDREATEYFASAKSDIGIYTQPEVTPVTDCPVRAIVTGKATILK